MKQNSIKGRLIEFFAFSYFNWLIVVPLLMPWVLFRLQLDSAQFQTWIIDSFFVSLFIGWWTVKIDNKFAPWFYKKMGWKKNIKISILETMSRLEKSGHGMDKNVDCMFMECEQCTEYRLCKRLIEENK